MPHDLNLWPFDPAINMAHPWLMGSKCMKFHDYRWITRSVIVQKPFSIIKKLPHDLDLLTPKSIGLILDSWAASVWNFMTIGGLQSQLWSGNHLQLTMPHDLNLWPFDPEINRAHPWLMGSKCMKFHDYMWITKSVIVQETFSIIKKSMGVCETLQYAPGGNKVEKANSGFKVKVKVTMSLTLVLFDRASLVEYACQIWSLYLLRFKSYSAG